MAQCVKYPFSVQKFKIFTKFFTKFFAFFELLFANSLKFVTKTGFSKLHFLDKNMIFDTVCNVFTYVVKSLLLGEARNKWPISDFF